jgi:hypothetical protein
MPPAIPYPLLTPHEALVIGSFNHRPVLSMVRLCSSLRLSRMTVFRALAKHGYFRSFNHNAHYYTLGHTPRFDGNGLWFYRSIGFSRQRTLPQTLLALVQDSAAGATPEELTHLLRTPVRNLLARLARQQQLARRRLGRCVVYLAADPQRQEQQWWQRQQPTPSETVPAFLPRNQSLALDVPVLVELIRSPRASAEQLVRLLRNKGLTVRPQQVQDVVDHFQLEKKEARYRSQKSFRNCSAASTTTCSGSEHFRKPRVTPLIAWLRRLPSGGRCLVSSRRGRVTSSASASAPCVAGKCSGKPIRPLARSLPACRDWCPPGCGTPTTCSLTSGWNTTCMAGV